MFSFFSQSTFFQSCRDRASRYGRKIPGFKDLYEIGAAVLKVKLMQQLLLRFLWEHNKIIYNLKSRETVLYQQHKMGLIAEKPVFGFC